MRLEQIRDKPSIHSLQYITPKNIRKRCLGLLPEHREVAQETKCKLQPVFNAGEFLAGGLDETYVSTKFARLDSGLG
jgi:hypothetical protein